MGEKFGNFETLPQKEPVKIFEGTCQTRNLFNFLDHGYEGKNFNLIENNYRDGTFDWLLIIPQYYQGIPITFYHHQDNTIL